ncbi:MAG: hypothetical protein D6798_08990 [Deltaproteobacteria bacterium]|nr:MAG: hypothetical protein D6798_08990 [Deltaproteobacteria bacterium]
MRWRLVDRIDSLVVGRSAAGAVCFDPALPLFEDHFPRLPVVPGVLLLESLAQLSGKLIGYTVRQQRGDWPFPIISMMNGVKFRRFVRPGQTLELHTELTTLREEMAACRVRGRIDGRVHVQAEQIFVFNAVPIEDPDDRDFLERVERSELARLWPGYPADGER